MDMYRQVITPDKNNHSIELPKKFFGKKVEVIMVEMGDSESLATRPSPPPGKKIPASELLETFGDDPGFPSAEELRSKAWPSKW